MEQGKVLVVEDDKAVSNLIETTLELAQYEYITVKTGKGALLMVTSQEIDVILLDLGLPDMDGLAVIQKIRTWSNVPIIVVSARGEDEDKIRALDEGADDYLTKPFSVNELHARIRVALRRRRLLLETTQQQEESTFVNGLMRIEYASRTVYMGAEQVKLTPIEYKLLILLSQNVDKVLTHNTILREIWGSTYLEHTPTLRVFMATLRKKIEQSSYGERYIQTHIGVGYCQVRVMNKQA